MTRFIGIIPARYASTRLPGKPLARIGDKTLIEHVYTRAAAVLPDVTVATDDERIADAVKAFGGNVVMTASTHRSGTERCAEVSALIASDSDVVVNIQGDEPFLDAEHLQLLMECFNDPDTAIATLATRFDPGLGFEALFSPDTPKVVFDAGFNALYFSRSIIPYVRDAEWRQWLDRATFYTHIGLYAYRASTLRELVALPPSPLEEAERLEQLRWLSAGYRIRIAVTDKRSLSVDTPADLEAARILYSQSKL